MITALDAAYFDIQIMIDLDLTLLLCIKIIKPLLKYQTFWFFSLCRARASF